MFRVDMSGMIVSFRPEEALVFNDSRSQKLYISSHSNKTLAFKVKINGPLDYFSVKPHAGIIDPRLVQEVRLAYKPFRSSIGYLKYGLQIHIVEVPAHLTDMDFDRIWRTIPLHKIMVHKLRLFFPELYQETKIPRYVYRRPSGTSFKFPANGGRPAISWKKDQDSLFETSFYQEPGCFDNTTQKEEEAADEPTQNNYGGQQWGYEAKNTAPILGRGSNDGDQGWTTGGDQNFPDQGWGNNDGSQGTPGQGWGNNDGGQSNPNQGWGNNDGSQANPGQGWGSNDRGQDNPDQGWGNNDGSQANPDQGWGSNDGSQSNPDQGWGNNDGSQSNPDQGWGSNDGSQSNPNQGWGNNDGSKSKPDQGWGSNDGSKSNPNQGWGNNDGSKSKPDQGWGSNDGGQDNPDQGWGNNDGSQANPGQGWGNNDGSQANPGQGWGSNDGSQAHPEQGWGSNDGGQDNPDQGWGTNDPSQVNLGQENKPSVACQPGIEASKKSADFPVENIRVIKNSIVKWQDMINACFLTIVVFVVSVILGRAGF